MNAVLWRQMNAGTAVKFLPQLPHACQHRMFSTLLLIRRRRLPSLQIMLFCTLCCTCTFKIYSAIRLSSRKCVINSVFSVLCSDTVIGYFQSAAHWPFLVNAQHWFHPLLKTGWTGSIIRKVVGKKPPGWTDYNHTGHSQGMASVPLIENNQSLHLNTEHWTLSLLHTCGWIAE